MNIYTSNTLIAVSCSVFTNIGAAINATMVFRVQTPDGVVTDYSSTIANPSTGQYTNTFLAVQVGPHRYEWIATGAAQVAAIGQFMVSPGTF